MKENRFVIFQQNQQFVWRKYQPDRRFLVMSTLYKEKEDRNE
jgi:hypothetical protein